ncbi:MAG: chemotaxis protein CheB [Candidatus Kariarchaeaceae archaeon]|jgi:two-component system chemotaxis response regulator CheB
MAIKVVVADKERDSNLQIAQLIASDKNISVESHSFSGLETISMVIRVKPDILILRTNTVDMTTEAIIWRILNQRPLPILILYTPPEIGIVQKIKDKIDLGLLDYVEVTKSGNSLNLHESLLHTKIHIMAKLNILKFKQQVERTKLILKDKYRRENNRNVALRKAGNRKLIQESISQFSGKGRSSKIIVIGASTGGPKLISSIIAKFPPNLPPIVIVQHMPKGFSSNFAQRLNATTRINVKEAETGEILTPGTIYVAPGGKHLEFHRPEGEQPRILLTDTDQVNFVKPSVDVTLFSACKLYSSGVISVILTGMGVDGREGSRRVKENKGHVLALRQEDSEIYGMNKAVIESNLVDITLAKNEIVMGIVRAIEGKL